MAWWKLEWIKLKKLRTQRFFRNRKVAAAPVTPSDLAETDSSPPMAPDDSRLPGVRDLRCSSAPASGLRLELASARDITEHFSSSGTERGQLFLGVLRVPPSELEDSSSYGLVEGSLAALTSCSLMVGRFSRLSPAVWRGHARVTLKRLEDGTESRAYLDFLAARELLALAELRHPGVLCLMGASFCSERGLRLVLEEVTLGSLFHCLHFQGARLSVAEVCTMFSRLTEALEFLHARSWLHLGLSSHAVLLTGPGQAKLGALELARPLSSSSGCRMGPEDSALQQHLISWQAPEQCLAEEVGTHTDVYSLAVTLQEALTRRLPWERTRSAAGGCDAKAFATRRKVKRSAPLLPPDFHDVIQRGLAVQREERTLRLSEIRELCLRYSTKSPGVQEYHPSVHNLPDTPVLKVKKRSRRTQVMSFLAFKRHLSSCSQACTTPASPYVPRKRTQQLRVPANLEALEEMYFDDDFGAQLEPHLQLSPHPTCENDEEESDAIDC